MINRKLNQMVLVETRNYGLLLALEKPEDAGKLADILSRATLVQHNTSEGRESYFLADAATNLYAIPNITFRPTELFMDRAIDTKEEIQT